MTGTLVSLLILCPMGAAAICYTVRVRILRSLLVPATGLLLAAGCLILLLWREAPAVHPPSLSPQLIQGLFQAADILLLLVFLTIGIRHRHGLIIGLTLAQAILLFGHEMAVWGQNALETGIRYDGLSLLMALVISLVGAIICIQAIPYMADHETHLKVKPSRQPRFFAVMLLFLGAMNGVVLSDSLTHFFLFFEVTTLCSYLLIGHDGTAEATRNALRALWMNSLGGAALAAAIVSLDHIAGIRSFTGFSGLALSSVSLLPLALICFAGFTKAAQFPFQSWLLGAMVAPTPVSALLHSATMVKAGVYLVLRVAPFISGTFLGTCVSLFGAFTFLSGGALAVGQRNGKRVLAYSTISNLGLMFACAGMGSPAAWTAAVFLLVFHAVTKALLFLCVGAIEQRIDSRDIEDMRGLYARMPATAIITVLGVITMIMPPFGLMVGKWMALEAAARHLPVLLMLALGSALTVMYWAKWAGTLMSDPLAGMRKIEDQPALTWAALISLASGAVILSVAAPWLYTGLIRFTLTGGTTAFAIRIGSIENAAGTFAAFPLCLLAGAAFAVSLYAVRHAFGGRVVPPYMCGAQTPEPGAFMGPMNQVTKAETGNYYFSWLFGEKRLTGWINTSAVMLLVLMMGGTLS